MKIKNIALLSLGFLLLGIGAVGIVLPIWPTTPFVILSVSCFSVSPKIQAQVMKIEFFRQHVENYRNRAGLPRRNVIISLTLLWAVLITSILITQKQWTVLLLLLVGGAVTIHIIYIARPRKRPR